MAINTSQLPGFLSAASHCAHVMMDNADYIEKELPNLSIGEDAEQEIRELCQQLIGTKHDVISDVSEMEDSLDANAPNSEIERSVERIFGYVKSDMSRLDSLVRSLEQKSGKDPKYGLAYMLVAESAANILNSFAALTKAREALVAE